MTTMKIMGDINRLAAAVADLEERIIHLEGQLRGHNATSVKSIKKTAQTPKDRVTTGVTPPDKVTKTVRGL